MAVEAVLAKDRTNVLLEPEQGLGTERCGVRDTNEQDDCQTAAGLLWRSQIGPGHHHDAVDL